MMWRGDRRAWGQEREAVCVCVGGGGAGHPSSEPAYADSPEETMQACMYQLLQLGMGM